ncbi:unnamed protein product [Porites lobata]|uniref:Uncharacterized protein n=1 Tax=Porites lobata TaxID=104759 RepID=A0ABN8Q189_9CNID|nr:unnamed protein product [Porites lobata]
MGQTLSRFRSEREEKARRKRRLIIRLDEAQEYIECLQERFQQMEKDNLERRKNEIQRKSSAERRKLETLKDLKQKVLMNQLLQRIQLLPKKKPLDTKTVCSVPDVRFASCAFMESKTNQIPLGDRII